LGSCSTDECKNEIARYTAVQPQANFLKRFAALQAMLDHTIDKIFNNTQKNTVDFLRKSYSRPKNCHRNNYNRQVYSETLKTAVGEFKPLDIFVKKQLVAAQVKLDKKKTQKILNFLYLIKKKQLNSIYASSFEKNPDLSNSARSEDPASYIVVQSTAGNSPIPFLQSSGFLQLSNGQLDINKMDFVNPAVHSTAERIAGCTSVRSPAALQAMLDNNNNGRFFYPAVQSTAARTAIFDNRTATWTAATKFAVVSTPEFEYSARYSNLFAAVHRTAGFTKSIIIIQHCLQCCRTPDECNNKEYFKTLLLHYYYPALLAMLKSGVLQLSNVLLCGAQQDINTRLGINQMADFKILLCKAQQLVSSIACNPEAKEEFCFFYENKNLIKISKLPVINVSHRVFFTKSNQYTFIGNRRKVLQNSKQSWILQSPFYSKLFAAVHGTAGYPAFFYIHPEFEWTIFKSCCALHSSSCKKAAAAMHRTAGLRTSALQAMLDNNNVRSPFGLRTNVINILKRSQHVSPQNFIKLQRVFHRLTDVSILESRSILYIFPKWILKYNLTSQKQKIYTLLYKLYYNGNKISGFRNNLSKFQISSENNVVLIKKGAKFVALQGTLDTKSIRTPDECNNIDNAHATAQTAVFSYSAGSSDPAEYQFEKKGQLLNPGSFLKDPGRGIAFESNDFYFFYTKIKNIRFKSNHSISFLHYYHFLLPVDAATYKILSSRLRVLCNRNGWKFINRFHQSSFSTLTNVHLSGVLQLSNLLLCGAQQDINTQLDININKMGYLKILLCKAQQLVHYYYIRPESEWTILKTCCAKHSSSYPALPLLSSIACNTAAMLKSGVLQHCKQCCNKKIKSIIKKWGNKPIELLINQLNKEIRFSILLHSSVLQLDINKMDDLKILLCKAQQLVSSIACNAARERISIGASKKPATKSIRTPDGCTKSIINIQHCLQCCRTPDGCTSTILGVLEVNNTEVFVGKEYNRTLFLMLWKWAKKRHNNRSSRWIYHRYWHKNIFYYENSLSKFYLLDYNLQRKKF
jgi:hypothetical protein